MSILKFLRIVDASGLAGQERSTPPPRQRKLALETLDDRALLTLFTPIVIDTVSGLVPTPPIPSANVLEPINSDPSPGSWNEDPPQDPPLEPYGGSDGGEGSDPPSNPEGDPPPEPITGSGTGSGGGEGGDPPANPESGGGSGGGNGEDPPADQNPGSGSGGGSSTTAPEITSVSFERMGVFVMFSGTVTDDESMVGQKVYFSTDLGFQFEITILSEGTFTSYAVMLDIGTQVSLFTIDADGNHSLPLLKVV